MVSTPIGAPSSPEKCSQSTYTQFNANIPNDMTSNQSPPLVSQAYPVLYTTPQSNASVPINVTQSPVSLYSEYMGNPYNLQNNYNIYSSQSPLIVYQSQQPDTTLEKIPYTPASSDTNLNNEQVTNEPAASQIEQQEYYESPQTANIFQSSNYFYTDPNATNIPPGSEILFGSEKNASSNVLFFDSGIKNNDIPLLSPPISKS